MTDGCVSEIISGLSWAETNLGINATLDCPCGDISLGEGQPTATRRCGGNFTSGAKWEDPEDDSCDFDRMTEDLCNVVQV